jgi:hypothetical protein
MKNTLLFLLVVVLIPMKMIGQTCLSGGITFDYQWQVDEFPVNFPGCRHILGNVIISDSAVIYSLDSLYTVDSISGDLQLLFNTLLPNFQGLNQLKYLGGDLDVHNSSGLENYIGLENLVEIKGDFNFDYFNPVTSFADFVSLEQIGGTLRLFSLNTNQLDFPVLKRINNHLHVSYGSIPEEGISQPNIFTGPEFLEFVGGDVRFGYDFSLEGEPPFFPCRAVEQIAGFTNLDTIGGSLSFEYCSYLKDAGGLSSLKYVGKDIDFNLTTELNTMDFLSEVTYIGGSFKSGYSGRDTTFTFLNNLQYLGEDFVLSIHRTKDLTSLQSFTEINGNVLIASCPNLSTLEDLENIKTIRGNLVLWGNDNMASLGGLEKLESIGDSLIIIYNNNLTSLQHLSPNLTIGEFLELKGNPNLSICGVEPICNYLEDPLAPAFIENNLTGCNTRPEVEDFCGIVAIQSSALSEWRITPNPSDGLYFVEAPLPGIEFEVIVFDLHGRQVHNQSTLEGKYLDIRTLPAGTYMVQIKNHNSILNTLITKM